MVMMKLISAAALSLAALAGPLVAQAQDGGAECQASGNCGNNARNGPYPPYDPSVPVQPQYRGAPGVPWGGVYGGVPPAVAQDRPGWPLYEGSRDPRIARDRGRNRDRERDRDGDGVRNRDDRRPDDPRYR